MPTKLLLKIGPKTFKVDTLAEASKRYQRERDLSGEGASSFPVGFVDGHRISYNGRVWLDQKLVLEAQ